MGLNIRWAGGDAEQLRRDATELVALEPNVILASTTPAVTSLLQVSRTVPIVFVSVIESGRSGLVTRLSRPGGNVTGFVAFEYALAAKWLDLLKEIALRTTRVAVLRDPGSPRGLANLPQSRQSRGRHRVERD